MARFDRRHECRHVVGVDLERVPADAAVKVAVDGLRENVELLAAVGAMTVPDDSELLEDVQRPVHG